MNRFFYTLFLLSSFQVISAQSGEAWRQKVAPTLLQEIRDHQQAPFLIVLSSQADLTAARHLATRQEKAFYVYAALQETALVTQKDLHHFLTQQQATHKSLFILNAIESAGDEALIKSLAQRNDVLRILNNSPIVIEKPVEEYENEQSNRSVIEWGIDMINADEVWALGYLGQGVTVGGQDTGYDWTHPALKPQYRGYNQLADSVDHNYNWHDAIHTISSLSDDTLNPCGLNLKAPCDDLAHGTHTMGTMIGLEGENQIGVAPQSQWCGCRNMERGNGSPFTYLECFEWFLAPTDLNNENPDPSKAPSVINNSWGCPREEGCDSSNWYIMNQVVNTLRESGIVVVVSAGNDGSACSTINSPASMYEGSFTIGATSLNDSIIGFSSRGPVVVDSSFRIKPNVSAPGVGIRSAKLGGGYRYSSGTSMAGPHVVGAVALMISANPELDGNVEVLEDILEQTAIPKTTDQQCGDVPGSSIPNNTYGYGRIDALAAVQAALAYHSSGTQEGNSTANIKVYPNPVDQTLIIDVAGQLRLMQLDLCDVQGKVMMHRQINWNGLTSYSIDFSRIPTGLYFYRIAFESKIQVGKLVKN